MTCVTIIGGGASAVLLAVHLLREDADRLRVSIVERGPSLGAGIAYATNHPCHLLNVRAANMSAFPDDPDHFVRWLHNECETAPEEASDPNCFVARRRYRDYLSSLVAPLVASGRVRHVPLEAVAIREVDTGLKIAFRGGGLCDADIVVIATGNEGVECPPEPWRFDGWNDDDYGKLGEDAPVVVVGTALTMVDHVLSLLHKGHKGRITAVSRRGLLPQSHASVGAATIRRDEIPSEASLLALTSWIRDRIAEAEKAGCGWREVIDGLRPHTQALWHRLPQAERRRFLRHARPYWDAHRHRVAPEAARLLDTAKARGQLRVLAGRIVGFTARGDGVDVHVIRRGGNDPQTIRAAAVFECRGRLLHITRSQNPFIQSLLNTGIGRSDPLGLGLAVTADCSLIGAKGSASDRLYAIGPVTAGTFWESTAIPEIRKQAQALAQRLRMQM
jgi:uncharacterized NAD(P)/FAD-binding protein YdhS